MTRMAARWPASGLAASFCFPGVPSVLPGDTLFSQPRDPAERCALMCEGIRRLAAFQPAAVALYAGPPGDDAARGRALVIDSLRRADEAAGTAGTRLVLEILRPSKGGSMAATIEQGLELIEASGARTIDILIDVWHVADYGKYLADIAQYAPRIKGLQVCDRPARPRSWMDRKLPGDGIMDIGGLLTALDAAGFDGWYELEIFSDDGTFGSDYPDSLWKLDPAALVAQGLAALARLTAGQRGGER